MSQTLFSIGLTLTLHSIAHKWYTVRTPNLSETTPTQFVHPCHPPHRPRTLKGTSGGWPAIEWVELYLCPSSPTTEPVRKRKRNNATATPGPPYQLGWDSSKSDEDSDDGSRAYAVIRKLPSAQRDIPSKEEDFVIAPDHSVHLAIACDAHLYGC